MAIKSSFFHVLASSSAKAIFSGKTYVCPPGEKVVRVSVVAYRLPWRRGIILLEVDQYLGKANWSSQRRRAIIIASLKGISACGGFQQILGNQLSRLASI